MSGIPSTVYLFTKRTVTSCASLPPWGRYRYRVAPQGYLASGDAYTHRFSEITSDIKNKRTIVDDTVLWNDNLATNFTDVCKMLDICHTAGLIFNSDKF